jgi:hypothetical protein
MEECRKIKDQTVAQPHSFNFITLTETKLKEMEWNCLKRTTNVNSLGPWGEGGEGEREREREIQIKAAATRVHTSKILTCDCCEQLIQSRQSEGRHCGRITIPPELQL